MVLIKMIPPEYWAQIRRELNALNPSELARLATNERATADTSTPQRAKSIKITQYAKAMKKQFKYLDGIITVDTTNGRTAVTLTDADGETSTLEEVAGTAATLTDEQRERITARFGDPRPDGQPY